MQLPEIHGAGRVKVTCKLESKYEIKYNFSLYKKLFYHASHHQLLNEYVWYNFFVFLSNVNCQEQSVRMQQTEKKKILGSLYYVIHCSMWHHF